MSSCLSQGDHISLQMIYKIKLKKQWDIFLIYSHRQNESSGYQYRKDLIPIPFEEQCSNHEVILATRS